MIVYVKRERKHAQLCTIQSHIKAQFAKLNNAFSNLYARVTTKNCQLQNLGSGIYTQYCYLANENSTIRGICLLWEVLYDVQHTIYIDTCFCVSKA